MLALTFLSSMFLLQVRSVWSRGGADKYISQSGSERFASRKIGLQLLQYDEEVISFAALKNQYTENVIMRTPQCDPSIQSCDKDTPVDIISSNQGPGPEPAPAPEQEGQLGNSNSGNVQQPISVFNGNILLTPQPPLTPQPLAPQPQTPEPLQQVVEVSQQDGMIALKEAISNPPSSWEDTSDVCQWEGINCKGQFVTDLIVWSLGLIGTLPPQLSALSLLQWVDFGENFFSGTLPEEYSAWKRLRKARFFDNTFSGTFPVVYSEWKNVENIMLRDNQLTGTLAPQFSNWQKLQDLIVYGNSLTGTLPAEYSIWSTLTRAKFERNRLTGAIPLEYSTWQSLDLVYFGQSSTPGLCTPAGLSLSAPTNDFFDLESC